MAYDGYPLCHRLVPCWLSTLRDSSPTWTTTAGCLAT